MTIQANGLYKADTGKIWQNKTTLDKGGELLLLGGKDSIDNWQEIDAVTTTIAENHGTFSFVNSALTYSEFMNFVNTELTDLTALNASGTLDITGAAFADELTEDDKAKINSMGWTIVTLRA